MAGAICATGGIIELSGNGNINNCNSINGGAVYISGGNASISGGIIENCEATENGGAMCATGGDVTLSGTGKITKCEAPSGGAIYIDGGNYEMSGGTIESTNAQNGGGIYILAGNFKMTGGLINGCATSKNGGVVYILKGNFVMESGTLSNNEANNMGGALRVENGNVTIGLESCKGKDETHECPVIKNNTAVVDGGAISMGNGVLNFYCGNLLLNVALNNQNGNAIHQTGGTINIHGGDTQNGFFLTGGTLTDNRDYIRQIRYHAAYDGINYTILEMVDTGTQLELPSDIFTREDHHLMGWSLDAVDTQGYMPIGEKIYITSNVEFYAVWNENNTYIIFIPECIRLDTDGEIDVDIEVAEHEFDENEELQIKLVELEKKLYLDWDSEIFVEYDLINMDNSESINNGDLVGRYTKDIAEMQRMKLKVKDKPRYIGRYTNTMSFLIDYITK